jgi:hypothetical protein
VSIIEVAEKKTKKKKKKSDVNKVGSTKRWSARAVYHAAPGADE